MQKRNRRLAVFRLGSFFDFAPHTPLYYYLFYALSIPFFKLVDLGEGMVDGSQPHVLKTPPRIENSQRIELLLDLSHQWYSIATIAPDINL